MSHPGFRGGSCCFPLARGSQPRDVLFGRFYLPADAPPRQRSNFSQAGIRIFFNKIYYKTICFNFIKIPYLGCPNRLPSMPAKKHPRKNEHEPHDAVFKAFFSDAKIARNYMLHYTPASIHQHIDFAFFQKIDTSFVSGRFGISFSDVLYEARLTSGTPARLLFLFEHKSYVPTLPIHLQLLDYLLQIWEDDLKNSRPLSFVIPIVVYHGTRGWKHRLFFNYFPGLPDGWRAFIPNFHYLLTDLSQTPVREIEVKVESEYLKNLFLALKFAYDEGLMLKKWPEILTFGEPFYQNDREGILLQTLTLYIFNLFDMTKSEVKNLNKQLP